MDKRYQVFVSSTSTDLGEERAEVMQALLELKCFPAGMELFPAANETQWNWIKRVIDESDYYLVIVAGRYGSRHPESRISYTEMEYRYALEVGKPTIGFLHQDLTKLPSGKCDFNEEDRRDLGAFRELVKQKLCRFYSSPQELGAVVSRSITQLKDVCPANGWVPALLLEQAPQPADVLILRNKIETLTKENAQLARASGYDISGLAQGEDEVILRLSLHMSQEKDSKEKPEVLSLNVKTTWNEMFNEIWKGAPAGITDWVVRHRLSELGARLIQQQKVLLNFEFHPITVGSALRPDPRQQREIVLQFRALGLITTKVVQHQAVQEEILELTEAGINLIMPMQAIRRQ